MSILSRPLFTPIVSDRAVGPVPAPLEEVELRRSAVQRGGAAVVVDRVEHAGHVVPGGGGEGRPVVLVERDLVAARPPTTGRPVMTDVWLGSVRVRSTTVRAFSVDAPCAMSRWKAGAPAGPSWVIASGLRPSTDTWITCSMLSGGGGGGPAVQLRGGPVRGGVEHGEAVGGEGGGTGRVERERQPAGRARRRRSTTWSPGCDHEDGCVGSGAGDGGGRGGGLAPRDAVDRSGRRSSPKRPAAIGWPGAAMVSWVAALKP